MPERLPSGYTVRPPTRDDTEAVAATIAACQAADSGKADMSTEELLDDWHGVDLATEAIAVSAEDGTIAGYADFMDRSHVVISVYGYVHPEHRGRGIGRFLVDWGEESARNRIPDAPEGARVVVQHYLDAANEAAARLLAEAGYVPARQIYVMNIDLDQAPPPDWPPGLTVRAFVPGQDDLACHEAVEDAFRDLWGRPPGTFERFQQLLGQESFDPGLWFLAEEDGQIAGIVLAKTIAGEGWVDAVGVRRPWRGRGLGLALLRQAFAEYHRRGVRGVGLSVDAESATGAPRLYGRAGMAVERGYTIHRKELRAGTEWDPEAGAA